MLGIEPKDLVEFVPVVDDREYRAFQAANSRGILIVPEVYGEAGRVLTSDGGDFRKWTKHNAPSISIQVQEKQPLLVRRSASYWLPLVFLATDIALPIYLNLVASYLYDKMKGALGNEKPRVHFSAVFEETPSGVVKRFNFEGDVDALQKLIKKFDLNEFLDDTRTPD
ncbi:MAG TPA: hypothetical protein VGD45_30070 [Steroidobacter sp.]|uniref:hypothetical protein n=1 Tax=Steroidobacter sp. TaxID=1978227 RepID=UPI002EDA7F4E